MCVCVHRRAHKLHCSYDIYDIPFSLVLLYFFRSFILYDLFIRPRVCVKSSPMENPSYPSCVYRTLIITKAFFQRLSSRENVLRLCAAATTLLASTRYNILYMCMNPLLKTDQFKSNKKKRKTCFNRAIVVMPCLFIIYNTNRVLENPNRRLSIKLNKRN